MKKIVYCIGLDDENRRILSQVSNAKNYEFRKLLNYKEVKERKTYPVKELLEKATQELKQADAVDGVVAYWDFPVTTMIPFICKSAGVAGPSPESMFKCEHKYWSRIVQKEAAPEYVPDFQVVDPFSENAAQEIEIDFPYWIKPVKSFASQLAFRVDNEKELLRALKTIRKKIGKMGSAFDEIFEMVKAPPEIKAVTGQHCLVEKEVGDEQCTVEGYTFQGEVFIHGIVDSVRLQGSSSFARYQYPSRLPEHIQQEIGQISKQVISHIGLDNKAFNIEFFYNRNQDKLWLLEINPRISQSHAELFYQVDGRPNHEIAVDLALGQMPDFQRGKGKYKLAAKIFLRTQGDGRVTRVPTDQEIAALEQDIDGLRIVPLPQKGERLSEMPEQDSYSFILGFLFVAGDSEKEILKKYDYCRSQLHFEIEAEPIGPEQSIGMNPEKPSQTLTH